MSASFTICRRRNLRRGSHFIAAARQSGHGFSLSGFQSRSCMLARKPVEISRTDSPRSNFKGASFRPRRGDSDSDSRKDSRVDLSRRPALDFSRQTRQSVRSVPGTKSAATCRSRSSTCLASNESMPAAGTGLRKGSGIYRRNGIFLFGCRRILSMPMCIFLRDSRRLDGAATAPFKDLPSVFSERRPRGEQLSTGT